MPEDDPAWKAVADKPWSMKAKIVAAYDAMIDRQVGQLLALLKDLDIDRRTVVFFCSDHGADDDHDGELDSCGPLRGKKRSVYEGGIRVPMIVRWPGRITAGSVSDHLCYFPDLLPTLVDLVGRADLAPAGIDGISFAPTLRGSVEQRGHPYLYWEWERYNWGKRQLAEGGLMQAVRVGDWKAVRRRQAQPIELYDLSTDIRRSRESGEGSTRDDCEDGHDHEGGQGPDARSGRTGASPGSTLPLSRAGSPSGGRGVHSIQVSWTCSQTSPFGPFALSFNSPVLSRPLPVVDAVVCHSS